MRNMLSMLCLLAAAGAAHAEWTRVGETQKATLHADAGGIRKEGGLVKMWDLADFRTLQSRPYGAPYLSQKTQREYDCTAGRARIAEQVNYAENMGGGEATPIESAGEWEAVEPAGALAPLLRVACGK